MRGRARVSNCSPSCHTIGVMPGLDPGIHEMTQHARSYDFLRRTRSWIAGSSPATTVECDARAVSRVKFSKKNTYPRPSNRTYVHRSLARRASSIAASEQGAVSDNDIAVERREAQRPASLAARIPITVSPLVTGDTAVDARLTANGRPGGPPLGQASADGGRSAAPWRLPALYSLVRREKKKGCRLTPGLKSNNRGGGALAKPAV